MREKEEAEQPLCRSLGIREFTWSTAETGNLVLASVVFKRFHFGANCFHLKRLLGLYLQNNLVLTHKHFSVGVGRELRSHFGRELFG